MNIFTNHIVTPGKILEESRAERWYVLEGAKGATAVELSYDGLRLIFNERSRARSIEMAKLFLRFYKQRNYYSEGLQPPLNDWAVMLPVFPAMREAWLNAMAEALNLACRSELRGHVKH